MITSLIVLSLFSNIKAEAYEVEKYFPYFIETYSPEMKERYQKTLTIEVSNGVNRDGEPIINSFFNPTEFKDHNHIDITSGMLNVLKDDALLASTVLCHEIGHGLAGGKQYKLYSEQLKETIKHGKTELQKNEARQKLEEFEGIETARSFAEGEADYYSSQCLVRLISDKPELKMNLKEFDIDVKTVCQQDEICLSVLQAHKTTTILLKENKDNFLKARKIAAKTNKIAKLTEQLTTQSQIDQEDTIREIEVLKKEISQIEKQTSRASKYFSYLKPSKSVVVQTELGHSPPQCRLDTFKAGYFLEKRPKCWKAGPLSWLRF